MSWKMPCAASIATLACASGSQPADSLNGYWSNADVQFTANAKQATLSQPCLRAIFAPLVLEDQSSFSVTSVTLSETGNLMHGPDDTLFLQGRVRGDSVRVQFYVKRPEGPVSDPIAFTLSATGPQASLVCTE